MRPPGADISARGDIGIQNNANHTVMRIVDSTISNTGGFSIYTDRLPRLKNTSCETSGAPVSAHASGTWNVYTNE